MFPGDSGCKKYNLGKFSTARCYTCVELALIFHVYTFFFVPENMALSALIFFLLRKSVNAEAFFPEKQSMRAKV